MYDLFFSLAFESNIAIEYVILKERKEVVRMIQIISDSGTLYSQIDAKNKGLYVIPLNIIVDHKSYRDYDTISSTELLKMIDEKKFLPLLFQVSERGSICIIR